MHQLEHGRFSIVFIASVLLTIGVAAARSKPCDGRSGFERVEQVDVQPLPVECCGCAMTIQFPDRPLTHFEVCLERCEAIRYVRFAGIHGCVDNSRERELDEQVCRHECSDR
jgi:hypothetical protein